jgi:hypothetical protein
MRAPADLDERRSRRGVCLMAASAAALGLGGSGALLLLDRPARGVATALVLTAAIYMAISGLLFLTYRCELIAGPAQAGANGFAMAPVAMAPVAPAPVAGAPGELPRCDAGALEPGVAVPAFGPALGLATGLDSAA